MLPPHLQKPNLAQAAAAAFTAVALMAAPAMADADVKAAVCAVS